jgi:hypothetical protein
MNASRLRIYTVLSEPFRYGFLMMARTLLAQNRAFDFEWRILHHPDISPLTEKTRVWLSARIPNLRFVAVDVADYENVFRLRDDVFQTPPRLWAAFLILEAFRDADPDVHVLCLDSDLICLGSLGPEVLRDTGFAAVEARADDGSPMGFFNTGVMAIGKDHRGERAFRRLMALRDAKKYDPAVGKADQALLSLFYTPDTASRLDWRFNVTKRHVPQVGVEDFLRGKNTVFFHFVGAKPWNISLDSRDVRDHEVVALWDRTVDEFLERDETLGYLEEFRDASRRIARMHAEKRKPASMLHQVTGRVRRLIHFPLTSIKSSSRWLGAALR